MKNIISILLLFTLNISAQEASFLKGKIIKIISPNEFLINSDSKTTILYLVDTELIKDSVSVKKSILFLNNRVLNKIVYFSIDRVENNKVIGSLLYNCEKIDEIVYDVNEIPCSRGSVLNIELIQSKYLKYVGKNEFLIKINNEEKPW